jgi:hypothetical protein
MEELGRAVPETDRKTIKTLNDLPDWMVTEGRQLARKSVLAAYEYVEFYVAVRRGSSHHDFTTDVLCDGQDAATWHIRDCLCISDNWDSQDLLTMDYMAAFDGVEAEQWYRLRVDGRRFDRSVFPGLVGPMKKAVRYWQVPEPGLDYYMVTAEKIEPVAFADLHMWIRRWFARQLAWHLSALRSRPADVTRASILGAVRDLDVARASPDAIIAADALVREVRAYGATPEFPERAGYLGPDAWYRDDAV